MEKEKVSINDIKWAHGKYALVPSWATETSIKLKTGKISLKAAAQEVKIDTILGPMTVYTTYKRLGKMLDDEGYYKRYEVGRRKFHHFDDDLPKKVIDYYNETFVGQKKTWCYLNKTGVKCSLKDVADIYDLFINPPKKKKETKEIKERCRYYVDKVNGAWHGDIHDISCNFKIKHFYALIDDTSRYCVGYKLLNTKEAIEVKEVFEKAISSYGKPLAYWSDNGGENYGKEMGPFLRDNNIIHIRTTPHNPQQNGKIEAFWKPLDKFLAKKKCLTIPQLKENIEKYIYNYNNRTVQSGLGMGKRYGFFPCEVFFDPKLKATYTHDTYIVKDNSIKISLIDFYHIRVKETEEEEAKRDPLFAVSIAYLLNKR